MFGVDQHRARQGHACIGRCCNEAGAMPTRKVRELIPAHGIRLVDTPADLDAMPRGLIRCRAYANPCSR